ncbi:hypothetical protein BRD02_01110 [Halobacteriales archaeon QS_8_69_73]|nr:MAG: hypothetical protein BRD02_01110 [Halobacteriales archaeon QS_8_69_73]
MEPGRYGREHLDIHDEGVLYEALAADVAGFGTVLEGFAVRPLTDVEAADLLSTTVEGDVTPARGWPATTERGSKRSDTSTARTASTN